MRNWWYINLSQNIAFIPNKGKRATNFLRRKFYANIIQFSLKSKTR